MTAQFTIYGEPKGKGRPRFSSGGGKSNTRTPDETILYENLVKTEYRRQAGHRFPDDAALDVRIFAFYSIPKSVSKKRREMMISRQIRPLKRPDSDNLCKIVMDSLNGIAYRDDAQVVDSMVRKFYDDVPRVVVNISEAGGTSV